ncbi:MAG: hypothetical protein K2X38_02940 [Gemmataceae bacterium]|nr:hypothetical protein [Gemmataceae bacterium]
MTPDLRSPFPARNVIPHHEVRMMAEPVRLRLPGQAPPAEPLVQLLRKGDDVEAIEVTCTCGKHIRLDLAF